MTKNFALKALWVGSKASLVCMTGKTAVPALIAMQRSTEFYPTQGAHSVDVADRYRRTRG